MTSQRSQESPTYPGRRCYAIPGRALAPAGAEPVLVESSGRLRAHQHLCTGCGACEKACARHHEEAGALARARLTVTRRPDGDHPRVRVCPQCLGPECLLVCPQGAIGVDEQTGARVVGADLCNGCGACARACHLGMIHVVRAAKTAIKCDLCGGDPQCVAACPQRALRYEPRMRP